MEKSTIKEIALAVSSAISEMNYINIDDLAETVAAIISIYAIGNESSEIEMERLMIERINIEAQIELAKANLKTGNEVDLFWLARAKKAYRIKGFLMEKAKNSAAYKKRLSSLYSEFEEKRKIYAKQALKDAKEYELFKKTLHNKNKALYQEIIKELFQQ